jgi:hypothetical protein
LIRFLIGQQPKVMFPCLQLYVLYILVRLNSARKGVGGGLVLVSFISNSFPGLIYLVCMSSIINLYCFSDAIPWYFEFFFFSQREMAFFTIPTNLGKGCKTKSQKILNFGPKLAEIWPFSQFLYLASSSKSQKEFFVTIS